jgi:RNA polymerase primary sigma factor
MSISLKMYLDEIEKEKSLSKLEEKCLFKKMRSGDNNAKEKIIKSNLKFVITVAKKYQNMGVPIEDLISEGNIGLLKALDKFDENKNYKFITYAVWWIRQQILRNIYDTANTIRIPSNIHMEINKIRKEIESLDESVPFVKRLNIVCKKLGKDKDWILYLFSIMDNIDSLNEERINSDGEPNTPLIETIADKRNKSLEKTAIDNITKETILSNLKFLSEREIEILNSRFGLRDKYPLTLQEIGLQFNISKERVRQIQDKSLEKLRQNKKLCMSEVFY